GLAIGEPDEGHTQRYLQLCSAVLPEANWRVGAPGAFGLTCSSRAVHESVRALELAYRSRDRRVPRWAFRLPRTEKLDLLAGYIDSDGSVSNSKTSNHGRAVICSVSRALVEDLRELAVGCSLAVTPVRRSTRLTNMGRAEVYVCVLSADAAAQLDLWHEKKASRQRRTKYEIAHGLSLGKRGYLTLPQGLYARSVRAIESCGADDVYDLTVDHESRSFIADGVVVHNCWREEHGGRTYWVVRKGCTPAQPGQEG